MPKTLCQRKIATRNAIELWVMVPKQEAAAASHQTTAHANCAFHLSSIPEAPLAVASMAAITAVYTCWSPLPLKPIGSSRANIEMLMAVQIDIIARPIVVAGAFECLCLFEARTRTNTKVPIIVTGQAR